MKDIFFHFLAAAAAFSFALYAVAPHADAGSQDYIVFAWSDAGGPESCRDLSGLPVSCLRAQVVMRGDPPEIVTRGIVVEYRLLGDPGLGLSGCMARKGDRFQADGLPVAGIGPYDGWEPYRVAEITVTDASGRPLARTSTAVPTSDEVCGLRAGAPPDEPGMGRCPGCHGGMLETSPGAYYGLAKGHGGLYCSGCHEMPHPLSPSKEASFYFRASQYQPARAPGRLAPISSCAGCHETSSGPKTANRRGVMKEFISAHGGAGPRKASGCNICHTAFSMEIKKWPHGFAWRDKYK